MSWLQAILSVLRLLEMVTSYLSARRLLAAGEAQAAIQALKESRDAVEKAQAARRAVRDQLIRNPASLHDDDGFKRPD